jgi:antitoxin (DNA-binding transcriptional repressor) of toxin-antitoxin stability system
MYDMMCNIMVKATSRSVHHAFSKYLDLAHEGQQILITKRGKPWARLSPIAAEIPKRVVWPDFVKRTRAIFKGRKIDAVTELLKMREEERW